jgi:peptide deformylase
LIFIYEPVKKGFMALRDIILLPDPRLRLVSTPIEVDKGVRRLVDDLFETMYEAPGIGLAAIQIAEAKRIFVLDLARKEEASNPIAFINPVITHFSQEFAPYEEGCLSIPEFFSEVIRPKSLTIKFQDVDGKPQVLEADGLLATCIQHEMDHLNGVLFIDHISRLKRARVVTKFTKLAKEKA